MDDTPSTNATGEMIFSQPTLYRCHDCGWELRGHYLGSKPLDPNDRIPCWQCEGYAQLTSDR